MNIAENLQSVQNRIHRAVARANRNPDQIALMAVCKTFPPEAIVEAYAAASGCSARTKFRSLPRKPAN